MAETPLTRACFIHGQQKFSTLASAYTHNIILCLRSACMSQRRQRLMRSCSSSDASAAPEGCTNTCSQHMLLPQQENQTTVLVLQVSARYLASVISNMQCVPFVYQARPSLLGQYSTSTQSQGSTHSPIQHGTALLTLVLL